MTRRILLTLTASVLLVLIAFLVPLWVYLDNFAQDRAQRQAVLQVQPLVAAVAVVPQADAGALIADFEATSGHATTVYYADGSIVGTQVPADAAVDLARRGGAFFTDVPGGRSLLAPVAGAPGGTAVIRMTVSDEFLAGNAATVRLILLGLGVVLLALAVFLGLLLSRSFLTPIREVSDVAQALASGDLSARVTPAGPPEIRAIGVELNRLAARVTELLRGERENVADLAHRLRTPVTALRLDVDSLSEPEERDRVSSDVDRLERMVDEVIREARRPVREGAGARCDATSVVRDRIEFWRVLAEDQGRRLTTLVPDLDLPVRVDPADLGDALDALLGNVFAHTPDGTGFAVEVRPRSSGGAVVTVADDGPGLPDDAVLRGRSGTGSTGLGLDIARRTAESSGGLLRIERSPAGGARVMLELGAPSV
ncbi:MAG: HAMP domain-containing sensor histidine kinase [Candidatus Nanopelagicales bacterium]